MSQSDRGVFVRLGIHIWHQSDEWIVAIEKIPLVSCCTPFMVFSVMSTNCQHNTICQETNGVVQNYLHYDILCNALGVGDNVFAFQYARRWCDYISDNFQQLTKQRGSKHEDIIKHANNKCHKVISVTWDMPHYKVNDKVKYL